MGGHLVGGHLFKAICKTKGVSSIADPLSM